MKTRKIYALLVPCFFMAVAPALGDDSLQKREREAELLSEVRAGADSMAWIRLAQVREQLGKFAEAIATWGVVKKRWGKEQAPIEASMSGPTLSRLADFYMHRLQRKRNLAARPPKISAQLRSQLARAVSEFKGQPQVDQLDLAVQADLDGDLIDEIVYLGSDGPLGKRTKKTMGVARWNGREYRVIWRTEKRIPFMVHVMDWDGDGWKEVFCGYTPDTDDAATLHFNGQSLLFL